MSRSSACGDPRVTELVWDVDACGTCAGNEGATIRTGDDGDWRPEQLLALSLESDLMSGFIRLARQRGLRVLGYVSAAHFHPRAAGRARSHLCVHPCIVVGSQADAERARGIMAEVYAHSELVALLRDAPRLELDVTAIDEQRLEIGQS